MSGYDAQRTGQGPDAIEEYSGGLRLRYPGGAACLSISRTVSLCRRNTWEAYGCSCRQAYRLTGRVYAVPRCILYSPPFRSGSNPMEGVRRSSIQPSQSDNRAVHMEHCNSAADVAFSDLLEGIRFHAVQVGYLNHFCPAACLHDDEDIIGSTMSATCVRELLGYGIDIGRPLTTGVASAGDYPTGAARSGTSTLELGRLP